MSGFFIFCFDCTVANAGTLPSGCLSFKWGHKRAKTNDPSVGEHTRARTQANSGGGDEASVGQAVIHRFSLWPIDSGPALRSGHNTGLSSEHTALPLAHRGGRGCGCCARTPQLCGRARGASHLGSRPPPRPTPSPPFELNWPAALSLCSHSLSFSSTVSSNDKPARRHDNKQRRTGGVSFPPPQTQVAGSCVTGPESHAARGGGGGGGLLARCRHCLRNDDTPRGLFFSPRKVPRVTSVNHWRKTNKRY